MINKDLERAFNPRSVAVVGDKSESGYFWLKSLSTFQGKLYSVQINAEEIPQIEALGVKNYLSLLDIPEPVDYVVVAVPRAATPRIVEDCIRKRVGGVSLFTAGFAESGTEEGKKLQKLLAEMATRAQLNLIGPNCMGIYHPKIGLRYHPDQRVGEGGNVGFIAQSGTHANMFNLVAPLHGVKISKSVSYGNAIVLDSTDYLEYFAQDPETRIIGMYTEGVKDGRRLFQLLKQTTPQKPVLIWKGGETEDGARAAASHTASLAESPIIWQALARQCRAIKVDNLEEMVDTIKALLYIKPTPGNRVGLVAISGGQSVIISDAFAKEGFKVTSLTQDSYNELASFFKIIGGSYQNPVDVSWNLLPLDNLVRILRVLDGDKNVDVVVLELPALVLVPYSKRHPEFLDSLSETLVEFRAKAAKPLFTVLTPAHYEVAATAIRDKLMERNIPSFPSFQRGAQALRRLVDYYALSAS